MTLLDDGRKKKGRVNPASFVKARETLGPKCTFDFSRTCESCGDCVYYIEHPEELSTNDLIQNLEIMVMDYRNRKGEYAGVLELVISKLDYYQIRTDGVSQ